MAVSANQQPREAAIISSPSKTDTVTSNGVLLVMKLADIQASYLTELQAAREKAKLTFLKPL
jgi:hypothetical protein